MNERKQIATTEELAAWYDQKYTEMGDGWYTPPEECNKHLDDLGVPFDKNLYLLDIGCGAGHFLAEAEKRVTCVGYEISSVAIARARWRCKTASIFKRTPEIDGSETSFDYVVSIGSLEHIVDLDAALEMIRVGLLARDGKFYFYCPNEKWKHYDQPNERTMTDNEWMDLFAKHGLYTWEAKRWNDSTAFKGSKVPTPGPRTAVQEMPVRVTGNKLNVGSGQRPFDQNYGWINLDSNARWSPDIVGDWNDLSAFDNESMDLVVSHHSLEHVGCGEGDGFIREAKRVIKPGGSLLVFVPDMRLLAQRWLLREIDDQIYMTNVYGAYMGDEADRHKWGYTSGSLRRYLLAHFGPKVGHFNWRTIPGADIARDWWILGMEAVK